MNEQKRYLAAAVAALGLALGGCAKDRPFEPVYKDQVNDKSSVPSQLMVYSATQSNADMSAPGAMPGYQGDAKLVQARFTKDALLIEEMERDPRYAGNPVNAKPVLSIPIAHVDYRCAENSQGECSNKEEENGDLSWEQKTKFKPTVESLSVQEVSNLPVELDNLFSPCYNEMPGGLRVLRADFASTGIRIEIERAYKTSIDCAESVDSLSGLTFKVRYVYSMVPREQIVSKAYPAIDYPTKDQNTFGFFTTEYNERSEDGRDEVKGHRVIMNRWAPNRKTIPYYLSANLDKPEYASIKAATLEAVDAVNNGLKAAKVDLQLEVKGTTTETVGDIRRSMIVMVEDPQDHSVIGYGPAVADPLTGEILSARVMMYYGVMKKYARISWDEYVEQEAQRAAGKPADDVLPSILADEASADADALESAEAAARLAGETLGDGDRQALRAELAALKPARKQLSKTKLGRFNPARLGASKLETIRRTLGTKRDASYAAWLPKNIEQIDAAEVKRHVRQRQMMETLSRYNVDPISEDAMVQTISKAGLDKLKDVPRKPWDELDEDQQKLVIDTTVAYTWVSTLAHELGHTLGLRHNFQGSEDAANFYSADEATAYGMDKDVRYSSVMDYGYNDLHDLHVMGKYDVAALRYGYNRQVEKTDGTIVPIGKTLESSAIADMKSFKYCTDENVGLQPGCRRFDEGTTSVEIAKHLLRSYEEGYLRRNFRNDRRSFSSGDDLSYILGRYDLFMDMRQFFERYELLQNMGIDPDEAPWSTCQFDGLVEPGQVAMYTNFCKDLVLGAGEATRIAEASMLNPVLTPDHTCEVAVSYKVSGKTERRVYPISLEKAESGNVGCFDDGSAAAEAEAKNLWIQDMLREGVPVPVLQLLVKGAATEVVAEYGKTLKNVKYSSNDNPYVDQIDVRGNWSDKVIGAQFVHARETGVKSFDDTLGNYIDTIPGSAERFASMLDSMLLDDLKVETAAKGKDGASSRKIVSAKPFENQMIPRSDSRGEGMVRKILLGMTSDETPLAQVLLRDFLVGIGKSLPDAQVNAIRNYYGIRAELSDSDDPKKFERVQLFDRSYVFLDKSANTFGMALLKRLQTARTIEAGLEATKAQERFVRLEALRKIALQREAPPAPAPVPPAPPVPGASPSPSPSAAGGELAGLIALNPNAEASPAPMAVLGPLAAADLLAPEEEAIVKLGSAKIRLYQIGELRDADFYQTALTILLRANVAAGL